MDSCVLQLLLNTHHHEANHGLAKRASFAQGIRLFSSHGPARYGREYAGEHHGLV